MCTKPFSQTKNKGKLFLVAKSSGPLLARMPLKFLQNFKFVAFLKVNGLLSRERIADVNLNDTSVYIEIN